MSPRSKANLMKSIPINILGTSAIAVLLLAAYIVGVRPLMQSRARLQEVRQETEYLATQSVLLTEKNGQLRQEIADKQGALESRYTSIDVPKRPMIEIMSRLLTKHKLELSNLRKSDRLAEKSLRINLQVEGQYSDFMRFLHDLTRMSIPARVVTMQVSSREPGLDAEKCSGSLQIDFFPTAIVSNRIGGQHGQTL